MSENEEHVQSHDQPAAELARNRVRDLLRLLAKEVARRLLLKAETPAAGSGLQPSDN